MSAFVLAGGLVVISGCCDNNNQEQQDAGVQGDAEIRIPVLGVDRVRAAYTYSYGADEAEIDLLLSHGINTVIIKGGYDNNSDYTDEPEKLPESVRTYATLARSKGFLFFQGVYFSHYQFAGGSNDSIVTDKHVVYSDGTSGGHVSPWDDAYWNHLTDLVVSLAELPVRHPDQYRIDGVMFDFEQYNDSNEPTYFTKSWGFEDSTFNAYLAERNIVSGPITGTPPPVDPDFASRAGRLSWLRDNDLLEDYYAFLTERMRQYGQNMKTAVKAVNPSFLLGAYPSPIHLHLPAIYAGWSSPEQPSVIWGTEMYYGGDGLGVVVEIEIEVTSHDGGSIRGRRRRGRGLAPGGDDEVGEDPGVAQSSPAHHHRGAAGLLTHVAVGGAQFDWVDNSRFRLSPSGQRLLLVK